MGCIQSKERIDFEETKALLLHDLAEAEKEIVARKTSTHDKDKKKTPQSEDVTKTAESLKLVSQLNGPSSKIRWNIRSNEPPANP